MVQVIQRLTQIGFLVVPIAVGGIVYSVAVNSSLLAALSLIQHYGTISSLKGRPHGRVVFDGLPNAPAQFEEVVRALQRIDAVDLDFDGTRGTHRSLTDVEVQELSRLRGMQRLVLRNNKDVESVSPLAASAELGTLDLSGTGVSDVSAITCLAKLNVLNLSATRLSDVSALSRFPSLQELYLDSTRVEDISTLASAPTLATLHVRDAKRLGDVHLNGAPNLRTLNLEDSPAETVTITSLNRLEALYIKTCGTTTLKLADLPLLGWLQIMKNDSLPLAKLVGLPRLETVIITHNGSLEEVRLFGLSGLKRAIIAHNPKLTTIDIQDSALPTDALDLQANGELRRVSVPDSRFQMKAREALMGHPADVSIANSGPTFPKPSR